MGCFLSPLLLYPLARREGAGGVWVRQQGFESQGGVVQLLVAQGQEGAIYYLLTGSSGVHRALSIEESWMEANGPANRHGLPRGAWGAIQVRALTVNPRDPLVLFAALQGVRRGRPTLYRTLDGGDTWRARGEMKDRLVHGIAIAPTNGQIVYVATEGALFHSADGGETWTSVRGVPHEGGMGRGKWRSVEARRYDRRERGDRWLVLGDRAWRSRDEGSTWQEAPGGLPRDVDWLVVTGEEHQSADGVSTWLALAGRLYRTTDGGRNWTQVGSVPDWKEVRTMRVSASNPDVLYVGTASQGLFVMRNGGVTWQVTLAGTEINALAQGHQNPELLYAATSRGVYRSMDGGSTWDVLNQEWAGRRVTAVALTPDGDRTVYASVEDAGVYRSLDGGMHWSSLKRGMGGEKVRALVTDPTRSSVVYATTQSGLWQCVTQGVVSR